MPRHIEHPASRHSKPASRNSLSSPSSSACAFTAPDPGTTNARTPDTTWRPLATLAAARRSSMRLLVRSEEHTSELQSLMRSSYAVVCLKKKKKHSDSTSTNIEHDQ